VSLKLAVLIQPLLALEVFSFSAEQGLFVSRGSYNSNIISLYAQIEKKIDFADIFVNIVNLGVPDFMSATQELYD